MRNRNLISIPIFLMLALIARAQTPPPVAAISGRCEQGATQASTSGMKSTNYQLGLIPNCLVTVYYTGSTSKATIFSDNNQTPLNNPFTGTPQGRWQFYVPTGQAYDVALSGGTPPNVYPTPVTLVGLYPSQNFESIAVPPAGNVGEVQINSNGRFGAAGGVLYDNNGGLNLTGGISAGGPITGSGSGLTNVPATGVAWPAACGTTLNTYDFATNSCIPYVKGPSVIPGTQITWPAPCSTTGNTYDFATNSCLPYVAGPNVNPGTQVTWPPACTTGVYVPATNTCVPPGTAANPAPPTGTLQMNSAGTFGPVVNSTADTSGNVTMQSLGSSVNKVINVTAAPYNAKCDLKPAANLQINAGVTPATGTNSYVFSSTDVGKTLTGVSSIANGAVSYTGKILSVTGGSATLSNTATILLYFWKYGTDDANSTTNNGIGLGIQGAFDAAFVAGAPNPQYTIYFPTGNCLFSTINWRGQSFYGAGLKETYLYGMPGQDMFQTPDSVLAINSGVYVHDLRLVPDISVDASAGPGGNGTYPNRLAGLYYKQAGATQTGTVITAVGSAQVNGQGTVFSSVNVGMSITVKGETHTITAIQDDTHLTTDATWAAANFVQPWTAQQVGTVTTTAGGTNVSGAGTAFLTSVSIGQNITAGGETHLIRAIVDNFNITTDAWSASPHSNVTYTTQGLTRFSPAISPGPYVFGAYQPVTGNNGISGGVCGPGATASIPVPPTNPQTVTVGCGATNLTGLNTNRVVGTPIVISGAGTSYPVTSWSITNNVATFQSTNSFNANDLVVLSGFGTTQVSQTGTITTTATQTAVVGTGTAFQTSLVVGATITIGGETHSVTAITDNTHLTTAAWTGSFSGAFTASNMGTYLNTMQPYPVLAAGLSGSQFSISLIHANQFSLNDSANAAGDYVGTITAVGSFTGSAQNLTITPNISTAVTGADGHMMNGNPPPWYFGNAAFAIQCTTSPNCINIAPWKLQNVVITNQQGGYYMDFNHVVGIWDQVANYAGVMDNVSMQNLYGGYIEASSNIGQASNSTADTLTFKDFNVTASVINLATFNGNNRVINGMNLYNSGGVLTTGPYFLSNYTGVNIVASGQFGQTWAVNSLYVEGAAATSGEIVRIMGNPNVVASAIGSSQAGYMVVVGSNGNYDGGVPFGLRVYGNANTFRNSSLWNVNSIRDYGTGNIFDTKWVSGSNFYMGRRYNPSLRPFKDNLGKLNADFLVEGNSATPYATLDDLITTCEDWAQYNNPSLSFSTYGSCTSDFSSNSNTEITPIYYHSAGPTTGFNLGGAATNAWSGRSRVFGQSQLLAPQLAFPTSSSASIVPMVKSTIYVRARCVGATTCTGRFYLTGVTTNSVAGASPYLTFTNNWSTQSFASDLSNGPLGDVEQLVVTSWTNTGTNWDMEWYAIVPQRSDPLNAPAWLPNTLYSAAGTPLPTCVAALKGQQTTVSDATSPTYLGTYVSGGAVTVPVICNGTSWVTH